MLRLRDIMTTDVVTVDPQTTLREAVEVLAARHVGGAPVVDGGAVVGVVSTSDLLGFIASTPPVPPPADDAQWDEWAEPPTPETADDPAASYFADAWSQAGGETVERFAEPASPEDVLAEHTVSEVMTRNVVALPPNVDVADAATHMRRAEVHRVLVMEGSTLLGIVTTTDVARAVADGRIARRTFVFDTSPVERDHDGGPF